ncbi:hypothetical protein CDL15_Pgr003584 [Punica granatum]|uniref:Uncharacterized protein n=1 Tax=Punica granatum TaxID=22663 RepID=A0A218XV72_PUNGR|nr:hypothetical protein CDL15_Pgr003584 [Punica granatum]
MALKGEGVLEWTEALENAFITILLEKFTRTHTTYWKATDWEQMNKELEEQFPGTILDADKLRQKLRRLRIFKTFQDKGCKHYTSLKELFRSKTATCALRISSTDPPKSP